MGAPSGNANAIKSGLHARYALTVGKLPRKLRKVQSAAFAFRRELEAAVAAQHGEITLIHAATIQTATRYETTAQLAKHWLTTSMEDLTHSERLQFAREVSRASAERDRCLRQLGLERNANVMDALYSVPVDDSPSDDERPGSEQAEAATEAFNSIATLEGSEISAQSRLKNRYLMALASTLPLAPMNSG